jgi:hypothetical protein
VSGITQALGINNFGEIVGHYSLARPILHGFLLSGGTSLLSKYLVQPPPAPLESTMLGRSSDATMKAEDAASLPLHST